MPVATPHFDSLECRGADYASEVVVAEDCPFDDVLDLKGVVCAINRWETHSGMGAMQVLVALASNEGDFSLPSRLAAPTSPAWPGSRRASLMWRRLIASPNSLLERHRPAVLEGVRKLGRTNRAPEGALCHPWRIRADKD